MNLVILQEAAGSSVMSFVMMGGIIVVFYFFFIRPQQKKQKETKQLQEALKAGDKVVTAGGFHATVVSVEATAAVIELSRGVNVKIDRTSIFALAESKA